MKGRVLTLVITLIFFISVTGSALGQQGYISNAAIYQDLKDDFDQLIEQAASKRIVALGEGTHGTKEFNEVRALLTQKLIKEKGFNYVLFESGYGGVLELNKKLQSDSAELLKAMKQHLIAIWQTKEIYDMLRWITDYNKLAAIPAKIGGIDYAELSETLSQTKNLLSAYGFPDKEKILNELQLYVSGQDEIWNNMGNRKFKFDRKKWIDNGVKAYQLINTLEVEIEKDNGNAELKTALLNLKLGFETIHLYTTQKKDASRDSCMAEMIKAILSQDPQAKIVVWAHNVHVANQPVFSGNNGGGMGAYMRKAYPDAYFAVATFTGTGTFSATTDPMPTRFNQFSTVNLEPAVDGSLKEMLGHDNKVIFTKADITLQDKIKMRFIGYGPQSGANTFIDAAPKLLYDAIIYLGKTNAAEHF